MSPARPLAEPSKRRVTRREDRRAGGRRQCNTRDSQHIHNTFLESRGFRGRGEKKKLKCPNNLMAKPEEAFLATLGLSWARSHNTANSRWGSGLHTRSPRPRDSGGRTCMAGCPGHLDSTQQHKRLSPPRTPLKQRPSSAKSRLPLPPYTVSDAGGCLAGPSSRNECKRGAHGSGRPFREQMEGWLEACHPFRTHTHIQKGIIASLGTFTM